MSTSVTSLVAVFGARLAEFQKGVNQAIDLTIRLRDVSRNAFRDISRAAEETGRGIQSTFAAVEKTATRSALAITAAMTGAAAAVGKTGFEFLKLKSDALLSFETLMGSTKKAERLLAQLAAFAERTPFELPGLIEASQQFLAVGMDAKKIIPTLTAVGDAVAGLGGDPEKIKRVTLALTQMVSLGKIQGTDMRQLVEAQIPAWQMLADVIGVTTGEVQEMAEKGLIKTADVFDKFVAKIGERFSGLMAKQSSRLGGLMSTASDSFRATAATIFEPLYQGAEKFLQWAMGPTGLSMEGVTKKLAETVRGISKDVFSYLQLNGQSAVNRIGEAFITFGVAVRGGVGYLREHGSALAGVVRWMFDWTLSIGKFLAEHPRFTASLIATKAIFLTGIPQAIGTTLGGLAKLGLELWQIHTLLRLAFGTGLVSALATAGRAVLDLAAKFEVLKGVVAWFRGLTLFSGWATAAGRASLAMSAMATAAAALKASLVIFTGYTFFKIGEWARQFVYGKDYIAEFNAELKKSISLTEELILLRERETGGRISLAMARKDPARGMAELEGMEQGTRSNIAGIRGQLKKFDNPRYQVTPNGTLSGANGYAPTAEEMQEYDDLRKRLALEEKLLKVYEEKKREIQERIKLEKQAAEEAAEEDKDKPAAPDDIDPATGKKNALTAEERRRQTINRHEDRSAEKSDPLLKGFSEIMKMIDSGATVDEIEEFIRDIEGMTPEIVEKLMKKIESEKETDKNIGDLQKKAAEEKKKDIDESVRKGTMSKEEGDLFKKEIDKQLKNDMEAIAAETRANIGDAIKKGITEANTTVRGEKRAEDTENDAVNALRRAEGLPKEEVAAFNKELEELRQAFIRGEISEKEYERGLDDIQDRIQKASQAMDAMRDAEAAFDEISQGNAVPEFAARFDELNQQLKQGEITVEEYRRAMGLLQGDMKAERDAEQSMAKMQVEGVDPMFMQQYEDLLAKLRNGQITLDDFRNAMGTLEQQIRAAQESSDTFKRIMEGTFGQTFGYGSQAMGQLQTRIEALKQALAKGSLSVDDFNNEMKKLETQAEKAAEAERQRRLLSGDFIGAGLDPQKALQERLASARMNQFNQMIDNMANQILGIGGQFQNFADGLSQAGQSVQDFAQNMPGSRDVGDWWSKINGFLQTIEGARQNAMNQLNLLRQSLQLTRDAFTQRDLQNKIDDLIRQLQVLDQQQANLPTFVGNRGEFDFADPGLDKGGGSGGGKGFNSGGKGGGVTFSLPNVTRITQTEATILAETVSREAQRRGRRI